ncbi:hypothetical protein Bca4012_069299 [Brassica carinata]
MEDVGKHVDDEMYSVRMAVHETLSTAERLIREADPSVKSTPSLRSHHMSYVNGVSGSPLVTCDDYNQETGPRNEKSDSVLWTSRPRSSRRNRKKRRSEHHRHGFTQDSFTVLLENREQIRQSSESSLRKKRLKQSQDWTGARRVCWDGD